MDSNGDFKSIDFELEPLTEVSHSCSATINGEFYIFGPDKDKSAKSLVALSNELVTYLMSYVILHAAHLDFPKSEV